MSSQRKGIIKQNITSYLSIKFLKLYEPNLNYLVMTAQLCHWGAAVQTLDIMQWKLFQTDNIKVEQICMDKDDIRPFLLIWGSDLKANLHTYMEVYDIVPKCPWFLFVYTVVQIIDLPWFFLMLAFCWKWYLA